MIEAGLENLLYALLLFVMGAAMFVLIGVVLALREALDIAIPTPPESARQKSLNSSHLAGSPQSSLLPLTDQNN